MSCRPKRWTYRGQHCFKPCLASRKGEMCQCKFDNSKAGQIDKKKRAEILKSIKEKVDAYKAKNNTTAV